MMSLDKFFKTHHIFKKVIHIFKKKSFWTTNCRSNTINEATKIGIIKHVKFGLSGFYTLLIGSHLILVESLDIC